MDTKITASPIQLRRAAGSFFLILCLAIASTFIESSRPELMALKDLSLAPRWETLLSVALLLAAIFAWFHWSALAKRNPATGVWIVVVALMTSFGLRQLIL